MLATAEAEILELREQLSQIQRLYYSSSPGGRHNGPSPSRPRSPERDHSNGKSPQGRQLRKQPLQDLLLLAQKNRLGALGSIIDLCETFLQIAQSAEASGDGPRARSLIAAVERTLNSRGCRVDSGAAVLAGDSRNTFDRMAEIQHAARSMRQRLAPAEPGQSSAVGE